MMPAGPSGHTGTFSQPGTLYIFKEANNPELAKEYVRFFYREEWQIRWAQVTGIIPLFKGLDVPGITDGYWYPFILEEQSWGARPGFWESHPKNLVAHEAFWPALMVQDVVLKGMSVEDALAKYQGVVEELYGEPCSPLVEGCE
jgi:ABC-type glycerol-3-phosphate transport system substrate-binding protein